MVRDLRDRPRAISRDKRPWRGLGGDPTLVIPQPCHGRRLRAPALVVDPRRAGHAQAPADLSRRRAHARARAHHGHAQPCMRSWSCTTRRAIDPSWGIVTALELRRSPRVEGAEPLAGELADPHAPTVSAGWTLEQAAARDPAHGRRTMSSSSTDAARRSGCSPHSTWHVSPPGAIPEGAGTVTTCARNATPGTRWHC